MQNMLILLNHDISRHQEQDAKKLGVKNFISLPSELHKIWENISPDAERLDPLLTAIKQWLAKNASPDDFVLIQGDFGACWLMVNFAFQLKLTPVYSTTERKADEIRQEDGSIQTVRQFKHVMFRKYGE